MKVAAFLPAKGSSSRIPNKNTMLLDGEPLFLRTSPSWSNIPAIDEVFLDTESARSRRWPTTSVHGLSARRNWRRTRPTATACSPGRSSTPTPTSASRSCAPARSCCGRRSSGRSRSCGTTHYDSVVAVRREKQYRWTDGQPVYDMAHIPNSVDLPETALEAMSLYAVRRETVLRPDAASAIARSCSISDPSNPSTSTGLRTSSSPT